MTRNQRRLMSGAMWVGFLSSISSAVYAFTGWVWWVVPATPDRVAMIGMYHAVGTFAGVIATIHWLSIPDPKPPEPLKPPPEHWSGVILNDFDSTLGAGWVIVTRDVTGELLKARVPKGWAALRKGFKVFGTIQGDEVTLTGVKDVGSH